MAVFRYVRDGRAHSLSFVPPARIPDLLRQAGLAFDFPCGGRGACLKCRARLTGAVSPMDAREESLLSGAEHAGGVRFLCMATALGDCEAVVDPAGDEAVETGAPERFSPQPWGRTLGAAFDLGTTTTAGALYSLETGRRLATAGMRNPQRAFGADVMSRLDAAEAGRGDALAQAARSGLRGVLDALCARAGVSQADVDSAVVAGNTAMLYLLTGRPVSSIARAPFEQDEHFGALMDPRLAGLPEGMQVFLPYCLSAYIGADTAAALLAARFIGPEGLTEGPPRLLADIGTNGEIALSAGGRLLCCSAAAGPAFEGAGISQGMPARDGAVWRVALRDGVPQAQVLGGGHALGLCGSGLLETAAALLETGVLDESGRLRDGAYTLPGTHVTLTQADVRALQLAKAAIRAATEVLLAEANTRACDVAELAVAGGFGGGLRSRPAQAVGLFPPELTSRMRALGNGALAGAAMALLSRPFRDAVARRPAQARTVSLATHPLFMDAYVDAMRFGRA